MGRVNILHEFWVCSVFLQVSHYSLSAPYLKQVDLSLDLSRLFYGQFQIRDG